MHAIAYVFIGFVISSLVFLIVSIRGRCSNGRGVSGTEFDHDRIRELEQQSESVIERAGDNIGRAEGNNRQLREDNNRAAELIKRGREILKEAYDRSEHP